MSTNTYHCTAGRGDEFYTRPQDVELLMEQYVPYLRDKNILIPCAGDDGPWATYLRSQGCENITTDPEKHYEHFDFSDYDMVISNIPFSRTTDFLTRLDEAGCEGLIVMPAISIRSKPAVSLLNKGWKAYDEGTPHVFNRPSGKVREVACYVLTSFRTNVHEGSKRRVKGKPTAPVMTDQGILRYGRVVDVPVDWQGVIAVPVSYAVKGLDTDRHTVSFMGGDLTVGGKRTFTSLYVSCDGSTVFKVGGTMYRNDGEEVIPLTSESTLSLAKAA